MWYFVMIGLPKNLESGTGLPLGQEKSGNQEKSGKILKNDKNQEKSGKNGGF